MTPTASKLQRKVNALNHGFSIEYFIKSIRLILPEGGSEVILLIIELDKCTEKLIHYYLN